jgi:hypothetical protein
MRQGSMLEGLTPEESGGGRPGEPSGLFPSARAEY